MKYVVEFSDITREDKSMVGAKAFSLGLMKQQGIPVPSGFVVTVGSLEIFKKDKDIEDEILASFDLLNCEEAAVRSSANSEDSDAASWAGQFESYLSVKKENLIKAIQNCYDSLDSDRVAEYAKRQGVEKDALKMGVIVQKMVQSEKSGVMFTVNPVTKNKSEILIEAVQGLGEKLAQGEVTPDNYIVNKINHGLISHTHGEQEGELILSEGNIQDLAALGLLIEDIFKFPQDIEWGIEKNTVFILQARPITTL